MELNETEPQKWLDGVLTLPTDYNQFRFELKQVLKLMAHMLLLKEILVHSPHL